MTGILDLYKIESKLINLKFDINLSKIESILTGMQTINLKLNLFRERVRPLAQGPASAGEGESMKRGKRRLGGVNVDYESRLIALRFSLRDERDAFSVTVEIARPKIMRVAADNFAPKKRPRGVMLQRRLVAENDGDIQARIVAGGTDHRVAVLVTMAQRVSARI